MSSAADCRLDIVLAEPLSSVVFNVDYIQLRFQDDGLSLYNDVEWQHNGVCLVKGAAGFCDALVGLIRQRAMSVLAEDTGLLTLAFENGALLRTLPLRESQHWPEAWQLNRLPDVIVVGQN